MKTILKSQDRRTEVGYKTFMYVRLCVFFA